MIADREVHWWEIQEKIWKNTKVAGGKQILLAWSAGNARVRSCLAFKRRNFGRVYLL